MKKHFVLAVVALSFAAGLTVWAHDEKEMAEMKKKMPASSAELQQIKQLSGKWTGMMVHMGDKKPAESVTIQFKVTSEGSAVEETLAAGTPHEMVDMYADEKGRLAMTHYCGMGNQPRMQLRQSGPHVIFLEMVPSPGLTLADPHMHSLTLEMPDATHLTERWTSYKDGKPAETAVMTLVKSK